tara:strand:+ start:130 stop:285 length:156 start_codon:yes stop_codon:yes gene_type:complete
MPELERLQTAQHTPKQPSHELLRLDAFFDGTVCDATTRELANREKDPLGLQ